MGLYGMELESTYELDRFEPYLRELVGVLDYPAEGAAVREFYAETGVVDEPVLDRIDTNLTYETVGELVDSLLEE